VIGVTAGGGRGCGFGNQITVSIKPHVSTMAQQRIQLFCYFV